MNSEIKKQLLQLYIKWSNAKIQQIVQMSAHGSDRKYFRIYGDDGQTVIGVQNADKRENTAFLTFSKQFKENGIPVPEIFAEDREKGIYLEQDLGDTTLFDYLTKVRHGGGFPEKLVKVYEKVIDTLPHLQITAGKKLNFEVCYPRSSFDKQSMIWDLNYFKYYFLKLAKISFDEQYLENDFHKFTDFLLSAERDFFMFRDFQSRNIMLHNDKPYFIDYQGGRKGALQYDVASLLFDAKADIPQEIRDHLLKHYLDSLSKIYSFSRDEFLQYYHGYVFIRIMQALGAYGFRGFYERKEHFLKSVPFAIRNLEMLLQVAELPVELPALTEAWTRLVRSSFLRTLGNAKLKLRVRIQSFSFRRGIPVDETGHGGGFVFDCRALPNPGRYERYKNLTGNDKPVIDFLKNEYVVDQFLLNIARLIDNSIQNYQERNFTDLMISFGCTGGQHRSVYCANTLSKILEKKYDIDITVRHREQEMKEH
ncbi:MAG: phosphotransferase [Deferribacteres bacterium]|nr:phosphotransferase [candidate division KSB1 bacterium]MCB9501245.1 phosphotransferase [Deferribacteres bacterium]